MSHSEAHPVDRKARIVAELKSFAIMTLYLWLVFLLFAMYRAIILKEHGVDGWEQTFAIINALIFAKVLLTAQMLNLGRSFKHLPVLYAALGSTLYSQF